jgi:class 3 adenylate cyclase
VRVDRCFAFVDLCGFTAFTDRHEDEQVVLVLAELRTALREAAARRGVRVVKWLGDGAMLSSTMTDALAGLVIEIDSRMASTIPSLAVRAGLDAGPVIMFEGDDYIGRSVNLAARLCDDARPHELLATQRVINGLPAWITASECHPHIVRGLDRAVDVAPLRMNRTGDEAVVQDPICLLEVPLSLALPVSDGEAPTFCSEACVGAWRDRQARRRGSESVYRDDPAV